MAQAAQVVPVLTSTPGLVQCRSDWIAVDSSLEPELELARDVCRKLSEPRSLVLPILLSKFRSVAACVQAVMALVVEDETELRTKAKAEN